MEKVFTNIEHAAWLREQARLKRPYWYGTCFYECTESLLQSKARQYPAHYGSSRMPRYRKDIANDQMCGDCVNGAIKGAIWSELGTRKSVYGSHGCPDKSADGMFEYCKSIGMPWGTISTMPDKIGLAVRFSGHVGVYVGNGEVVEWRGFDYGCVVTKLNSRKWLHWYELPWIEYDEGKVETVQGNYGTLGSRLLKRGSTGDDVAIMQELLESLGFDIGAKGADGIFGAKTEAAVIAYQKREGLEADGKYGAKTHAALMADVAEDDIEDEPEADTFIVTVTGGSVCVRKGASTAYDVITYVRKGQKLTGFSTASNGWHCVEINGKTGWISGKYTTKG